MMENIVKKRQGYTDMHVALAAVSWGRGDRCVCVLSDTCVCVLRVAPRVCVCVSSECVCVCQQRESVCVCFKCGPRKTSSTLLPSRCLRSCLRSHTLVTSLLLCSLAAPLLYSLVVAYVAAT
jgi:hypothetical protein